MRYLENRGLIAKTPRKVWAFVGDGETDEPETLGSLNLGSREKLDNLIFVVNCNLQRLDGPVRGNGKIVNELEAAFRGAGWNVIKVMWGSDWDPLFARDKTGLLLKRMEECVDGELQTFKAKGGAYIRKEFFGKYPELLALVEHMSDDELHRLHARRPRPAKGVQRVLRAMQHTGVADRDSGADGEGLRSRLGGSAQCDPLREEAGRSGAVGVSHAVRHSDSGVGSTRRIALPAGGR